jgi:hypothetical protein
MFSVNHAKNAVAKPGSGSFWDSVLRCIVNRNGA